MRSRTDGELDLDELPLDSAFTKEGHDELRDNLLRAYLENKEGGDEHVDTPKAAERAIYERQQRSAKIPDRKQSKEQMDMMKAVKKKHREGEKDEKKAGQVKRTGSVELMTGPSAKPPLDGGNDAFEGDGSLSLLSAPKGKGFARQGSRTLEEVAKATPMKAIQEEEGEENSGPQGKKGQWDDLKGTNEGALASKKAMGQSAVEV